MVFAVKSLKVVGATEENSYMTNIHVSSTAFIVHQSIRGDVDSSKRDFKPPHPNIEMFFKQIYFWTPVCVVLWWVETHLVIKLNCCFSLHWVDFKVYLFSWSRFCSAADGNKTKPVETQLHDQTWRKHKTAKGMKTKPLDSSGNLMKS